MQELIEYIAKSIVDKPEAVVVDLVPGDDMMVVRLTVAPEDMGKVIGRQGRVAQAMRTLLRVASVRRRTRAILEIG